MAEYNGWTNYETWSFSTWLDEDNLIDDWRGYVKLTEDTSCVNELSKFLEERAKEEFYDLFEQANISGWMHDISACAILRINFYEIAELLIEHEKEKEKHNAS